MGALREGLSRVYKRHNLGLTTGQLASHVCHGNAFKIDDEVPQGAILSEQHASVPILEKYSELILNGNPWFASLADHKNQKRAKFAENPVNPRVFSAFLIYHALQKGVEIYWPIANYIPSTSERYMKALPRMPENIEEPTVGL